VKSQVQRRLVAREIEELVHTYEAGATVLALAERFQISRATVMAHVRRSGAESRYNRLAGRVDEARRLYELGWSLARVAAHFDVSPGTVLNAFNRAGVATRPVGTNQWSSGP
jgi:AraC-like DNA-binding protein